MNPTYKVIIFYEGREYTEYVIDASTKAAAEKHAIANFKKKKGLKNAHVTAHADTVGSGPPEVQRLKFFPSGIKPSGKTNWRIKVIKEQLVPREFKYRVTAIYKTKTHGTAKVHVDVVAYSSDNAMLKGKRELSSHLHGSQVIKWEVRRVA